MKKIFTAVVASALVLASSCGSKSNENVASSEDKVLGDTLSMTFGKMQGAQALNSFKRYEPMMTEKQKKDFKKEEFLKGLELVLTTDTTNLAFLNGVQQGLQMYGILMDKNIGVPVDAKLIVDAFRQVYSNDTISQEEMAKINGDFEATMGKIREKAEAKIEAEARESQEAKDNVAAGEKYAQERLAEGFQKSESGLVYKINNPGEGEKVAAEDVVLVTYVGKHIDGTEFDRTVGENPTRMAVANLVDGFKEGLYMLGKGGSATLVVPGELGYKGKGRGPIGKMETLVFEIVVNDIEKPAVAKPAETPAN